MGGFVVDVRRFCLRSEGFIEVRWVCRSVRELLSFLRVLAIGFRITIWNVRFGIVGLLFLYPVFGSLGGVYILLVASLLFTVFMHLFIYSIISSL